MFIVVSCWHDAIRYPREYSSASDHNKLDGSGVAAKFADVVWWFGESRGNVGVVSVIAAAWTELKFPAGHADTRAMLSPTLQFDVTPEQKQLLHAYQAQAATLKVTAEEFDGWLERIDQLSGIEADRLTGLHGQLIASGLLKFELSGRNVGLKYQLSQQGRKALEKPVSSESEDDEQPTPVLVDAEESEDHDEVRNSDKGTASETIAQEDAPSEAEQSTDEVKAAAA